MLGKLMKHELRATARTMLPMIAALLVISILANLSFRSLDNNDISTIGRIFSILIVILFFVGIFAAIIVAVVLMEKRFSQNYLNDEGYIMMTLPVSIHSLIWSKLLVSAIWFAATFAVVALSGAISIMRVEYIKSVYELIKELITYLPEEPDVFAHFGAFAIEGIAVLFLSCVSVCLMVYASLATGHSFANKKSLLSVVAFFAYFIASDIIINLLHDVFEKLNISLPLFGLKIPWCVHLEFAYAAIGIIIYGAVYYLITTYMMKKHLNLE